MFIPHWPVNITLASFTLFAVYHNSTAQKALVVQSPEPAIVLMQENTLNPFLNPQKIFLAERTKEESKGARQSSEARQKDKQTESQLYAFYLSSATTHSALVDIWGALISQSQINIKDLYPFIVKKEQEGVVFYYLYAGIFFSHQEALRACKRLETATKDNAHQKYYHAFEASGCKVQKLPIHP